MSILLLIIFLTTIFNCTYTFTHISSVICMSAAQALDTLLPLGTREEILSLLTQ